MNSSNWPRNRLLLALPSRDLKRLMPELEHIRCRREQILMDADSSLDHVFFPDSGVVSVVAVYADGSVIEMATTAREGCTGMQAFFGAKTSSVRLLVQIPGSAAKMSRATFARAMVSMPSFRNLMSAYVHAFLEQVLVSVACNGAHSLKQRLARSQFERAAACAAAFAARAFRKGRQPAADKSAHQSRNVGGDGRHHSIPSQPFHEQVSQTGPHQLQRAYRGQQFAAKRGFT